MDASANWSARAVRRMIEQILDETRAVPEHRRGLGDPFVIDVTYKPDEWFPPTSSRGCWELVGMQPNGHEGQFFRQSLSDAAEMVFTLVEYAIHYGDHDRSAVWEFAERVNVLYGG